MILYVSIFYIYLIKKIKKNWCSLKNCILFGPSNIWGYTMFITYFSLTSRPSTFSASVVRSPIGSSSVPASCQLDKPSMSLLYIQYKASLRSARVSRYFKACMHVLLVCYLPSAFGYLPHKWASRFALDTAQKKRHDLIQYGFSLACIQSAMSRAVPQNK
jgi:hypothetical protein